MNSMTINALDGSNDTDKFWLALAISVLLHSSVYYGLPYLRSETPPPLERIEITLDTALQPQAAAPAPAVAPPPEVEPVPEPPPPKPIVKPEPKPKKEKPVETPPVLATEAPEASDDYVVPAAPEPEVTEPEVTAPEEPAPMPEPVPQASTSPVSPPDTTVSSAPAAAAVSSAQPTEATAAEAWNGYGQLLYNLVGKNKNYPQIAIRRSWEGEVRIYAKFIVGKLVDVTIVTSSGHEVLDEEALAMVRKAAKQLPVSGDLARKSFTVTIPVAFKLFS